MFHEKEDVNTSGRDESTDSWHTSGYKLCSFPVDLFIYSYETDVIQGFLKKNEKKLARPFNFRFCNIDCIYPIEIEIKIPQIQLGLLHSLTYTSKLTAMAG